MGEGVAESLDADLHASRKARRRCEVEAKVAPMNWISIIANVAGIGFLYLTFILAFGAGRDDGIGHHDRSNYATGLAVISGHVSIVLFVFVASSYWRGVAFDIGAAIVKKVTS